MKAPALLLLLALVTPLLAESTWHNETVRALRHRRSLCIPVRRRPVSSFEEVRALVVLEREAHFVLRVGSFSSGPLFGQQASVLLFSEGHSLGGWDPAELGTLDKLHAHVETAASVSYVMFSVRAFSFLDNTDLAGPCALGSVPADEVVPDWRGGDDPDVSGSGDDGQMPAQLVYLLIMVGLFALGALIGGIAACLRYYSCRPSPSALGYNVVEAQIPLPPAAVVVQRSSGGTLSIQSAQPDVAPVQPPPNYFMYMEQMRGFNGFVPQPPPLQYIQLPHQPGMTPVVMRLPPPVPITYM